MVRKYSMEEVNYKDGRWVNSYPDDDNVQCSSCKNYQGSGLCKLVKGWIYATGWCNKFEANKKQV